MWTERTVDSAAEQSESGPTPLWRDPLFSPGDRFPLGPPHWHWEGLAPSTCRSPRRWLTSSSRESDHELPDRPERGGTAAGPSPAR